MYGAGGGGSVISSGVVTSAGVILLPNTHGNTFGVILACAAIAIGGTALLSQVIVRIVRRKLRA